MSFIPEFRSWFFRTNAPTNIENKKINLENGSRPDQDLFERLTQSVPFKKEIDDRAKTSTGGAIEEEVGIVSIAPDTDVVNAGTYVGASGLEVDRTKVVHAGQLSTVNATETDTIADFNDIALSVSVDAGVTTRNNFLLRLANNFKTWLATLRTDVNTAQGDIIDIEGVVYGPGGTLGSPTVPGLLTTIYGPAGDPTTPGGPSVLETLYGPGGTPSAPGTGGLIDSTTEGTLQVQDNASNVGTTTKTLDFYSTTDTDVVATDLGSNTTRVDFSTLSGRVTTNASNISTNSTNISNLQTAINNGAISMTDSQTNAFDVNTIDAYSSSDFYVSNLGSGVAKIQAYGATASNPTGIALNLSAGAATLSTTAYTAYRLGRFLIINLDVTITVTVATTGNLEITLANPYVFLGGAQVFTAYLNSSVVGNYLTALGTSSGTNKIIFSADLASPGTIRLAGKLPVFVEYIP